LAAAPGALAGRRKLDAIGRALYTSAVPFNPDASSVPRA